MPAIQPARLKQQAALLVGHFDDPPAFVRSLHYLLDFYADRAHRPGQAGEPPPLLHAYHVRPPVLRQVLLELAPHVSQSPLQALALCDALWEQPYLEFRQLATQLLGQIPASPPEPVLARVAAWLKTYPEQRLVNSLLTAGLARLRKENPQKLIRTVDDWLSSPQVDEQQAGLRTLLPLIREGSFDDLPVFFRMIAPFTRVAPSRLRPDLLDVIEALALRSPGEVAYLLRQNLALPNSPDTAWLVRQVLRLFPADIQANLRSALRGMEREGP